MMIVIGAPPMKASSVCDVEFSAMSSEPAMSCWRGVRRRAGDDDVGLQSVGGEEALRFAR